MPFARPCILAISGSVKQGCHRRRRHIGIDLGREQAFTELVVRLRRESREFAQWWRAHDVGQTHDGWKVLHRAGCTFPFMRASLQSNDGPGLRSTVYTPVYTPFEAV